jgi:DHA2 family multidrug resistance protein
MRFKKAPARTGSTTTRSAPLAVSTVGGGLFFWRALTYRQPIVDLRAYRNRNFAFGSFFTFVVGIGMYGTTYLVPLFLAQVRGYNALQIGLGLFAFSMYLTATLTNQTGFWELFVPQVIRGLGLICCYLPANMIALGTLPQDKMTNAAGLYNLTRDLGGAIGLATIVTIMNERLHFHWNRLIEDINPARASFGATFPRFAGQPF